MIYTGLTFIRSSIKSLSCISVHSDHHCALQLKIIQRDKHNRQCFQLMNVSFYHLIHTHTNDLIYLLLHKFDKNYNKKNYENISFFDSDKVLQVLDPKNETLYKDCLSMNNCLQE